MLRLRIFYIVCLCGLAFGNLVYSQSSSSDPNAKILTLQQAIDYALQRSFNVKFLGLSLEAARQNLIANKGKFKTNAVLGLETPNLSERLEQFRSRPNELSNYITSGTTRFSSVLDVNQPLPTNGVFTLFSQLYQQEITVSNSNFAAKEKARQFFTSIGLRLRQPLFTINTLKLGYEEANLNYERASGQIRRTVLDVIYDVTQAFYGFHRATRSLEIAREEVKQQEEAYNLASKKYAAGLIPEVEALQTEVDLAQSRNRLLTAERTIYREEDFFKQTIGMLLTEKVAVQTQMEFKPFAVDLEKAIAHALANRSEIREQEIERRLQEIELKRTNARSEFKAEFSASYDLSGVSNDSLPFHLGTGELLRMSWNNLKDRPKNRGMLFSITMPLWDSGVNGAEVSAAKARLDQSVLGLDNERITVEREIKDVVARVREAENRLGVLEKSQKLAERSYEISLARFDNGDITAQELSLDRNRLTQARSAYLDAYIDYQTAVADLKRKTLYDFENNRSLMEEAQKK